MVTNRLLFRRLNSWFVETASRYAGGPQRTAHPAIVYDEFIVDPAPTAMSHASSIAASGDGLVAAWFGGSLESRPDVAVFVARNTGNGWSGPREVATGKQDNGGRYACWNPVLFQPAAGPLLLFYKVGKNPRTWWGMLTTSEDGGKSWSPPRHLPDGILGPIKNKPVQLAGGEVLCPSSAEHDGWRVHLEHSCDRGESWWRTMPIGDGDSIAAIQPSILVHRDGQLQLLCRSKHHRIAESWSGDNGVTWSELELTDLPNPNSGTDAVTLADGRHLLVYNHSSRGRSPLNVGLSVDGRRWRDVLVLEQGRGEYSYPAVIQTEDGLVHITYSWNLSRIRHITVDPSLF
ncbi:MAG TPA: sialidase [Gammaproteobacteria bacterium]|nr:sialidase [Gammaproteobacteria bacterium]